MSLAFFFAIYCLEAGVIFTVAPWTRLWTLNPLLHHSPQIALLADNPFVRGFVSGFGIVHLMIGVSELLRLRRAGLSQNG
jgi:hypothetical protein